MKLAVVTGFLLLNAYVYHVMARNPVIPPRESFEAFPMQFGEWRCQQRGEIETKVLRNLGATDYLLCDYRDPDGTPINVYIGYHETQVREEGGGSKENSIHPPAHCLPGSGWDIIANDTVPLDIPSVPGDAPLAKRLVIAKGNSRQLVYYWYQSRGRAIATDWKKIIYVGLDRGLRGRSDGSLVRFTVPIVRGDDEKAERAFRELAPQVLAELSRYVPV